MFKVAIGPSTGVPYITQICGNIYYSWFGTLRNSNYTIYDIYTMYTIYKWLELLTEPTESFMRSWKL